MLTRLTAFIAVLFVSLSLLFGGAALAQEPPAPDYDAWNKQAGQVEQILQADQANDKRLQALRDEMVIWRDRFNGARGGNGPRIATLRDQIAALGAAPAEGATEADDIAARRKELNAELSKLQAPGITAGEAYGRADSIVQQIDQTLRQRQAHALIRKTPSPLNPANLLPAVTEAADVGRSIYQEAQTRWDNAGGMTGFTERLPLVLGLLLVAALLLSRGRRWIDSLPLRLSHRAGERSRATLVFGVSLGQIAVPLLGVILVAAALAATDLFADWGMPVLRSVPAAGLSFFGGIWLARRMFPDPESGVQPPMHMDEGRRRQTRFTCTMLAMSLGLHQLVARSILPLAGFNSQNDDGAIPQRLSEASAGVWHLLLILLGALFLFRLGNGLRKIKSSNVSETPDYRVRIVVLLGGLVRLVAVVAPLMAMVGYVTAGNALLWSSIMTLGLVGLLIVLQDFFADLYAMAKGGDQSSRDALMPVLVSFALVVISLPLFALIWGARPSDLAEAWARTQQGFSFGSVRLSPMAILTFMIVFAVGYSLTSFVQGAFRTSILPKTKLDTGGQNAVVSMMGYVGIGLASVLAITSAGINLSSLAFVAGALSVGIGFGMQQVVSNFVSGIILLIERPIAVGDWIEVGGQQGVVKKMAVRATQIQTFDRTDVIVPNSNLITQPVTNWTRSSLQGRIVVPIGVAYGSDTRQVAAILKEIAEDQPTVLITPPPAVLLRGFGADSINFEIRAVLSDINGGIGVTSEINHEIIRRFTAAGINIPFAQRDVWLRNPEAVETLTQSLNDHDTPEAAPSADKTIAKSDAAQHRDDAPGNDGESPAGFDDGDNDGPDSGGRT